ncbi:prepilin-type N-terminal cleavage/methylation domain-containing protein [Bacillus ginsengihumi]|uniref:Prepilin-type N-terminal cleavage/methylation domain-containing protein n=1 Tax=Heyndrickxia ginsengihumi TaxID=363870 RepID=A0A6M0P6Z2_9BACI|nr:prepilin-type N-terminal cleavage/methylation domain-containing protein [Bacillus sp. (in: firmicutes)]NEY20045.1 prepilin-type N-terminal cleavage/methylation domain-containing protein [Heyndrickxia ginsengihumi]
MKTISNEEQGFTLIEMLIVILVMTIVASFGFINIKPLWTTVKKHLFINQLQVDLYYAQTYAITKQTNVYVQFYERANRYMMTDNQHQHLIVDRKLPENVDMLSEGTFSSYTINPDGNVTNFGTIYFRAGEEQVKLVVNIGRGRFYVQE